MVSGGILSIPEQIQFLASQGATGALEITDGRCSGTLYLRGGRLVDAECEAAGLRGFQAVACLVRLPGSPVSRFVAMRPAGTNSTNISVAGLLFEAARLADAEEVACRLPEIGRNDPVPTGERTAGPELFLRVIVGDREAHFPLPGSIVRVGRDDGCDICLEDVSVSRRHAALCPVGPAVVMHDIGSRNGTFVNGRRIERAPVARGDEIRFAAVQGFLVGADTGGPRRKTEPLIIPRLQPGRLGTTMCIPLNGPGPQ